MNIALLPGGQRSLVEQVCAVYDERLFLETKMFAPLWERALMAAVANVGIAGLAALTERTTAAVRSWVNGKNIPQQDWRFKRVLEASGDEEVAPRPAAAVGLPDRDPRAAPRHRQAEPQGHRRGRRARTASSRTCASWSATSAATSKTSTTRWSS